MKKLLPFLALILLISPLALAQCPAEGHTVVLKAPAVSKTANGDLIGVATEFVITVAPGSGHVYVETWPLAEVDMQASARLAAQVAGRVLGVDMSKYDVFIQVKADSPIIGGPSAGGTMTVGIIAALKGWKLRNDVMMTGMINPDGTIGPVGGILEKASAAHSVGAKLFLIPEGQRIQVVQKTEQKQIGPLVQITTKEEKVDVVQYAKERWGLEVKEVKDIYEAVYYFTGHKIEKPQAPENIKIDTSFLKEDAERDYKNTTEYYKQVEKKLKESDVSYTTYSYLKAALEDANQTLKDAKDALDSGMYYTALSKDFQARIIIRHVDWYLDVQNEKDIEKLLNSVNDDIKNTENYVSNLTIRGTTMLQAVAASEERIEQAKSLLKDAWSDYYKGDYWNAVSNAAFAYERVQTAKFWAKLGERYAKGDVISRDVIKETAREYLDNARLVVTYITSMFGESLMQGLVDELNKGEQYYEDGKYSAALFSAMEARIRAEVILDTLGIDNETVLTDKLQQMKEDAKTAIAIAQSKGVYPILGMAYYEFAQSYEKQGGTENIQTAMIFYQYAKETAMMFLPKTVPKITESTITPQIIHPSNTQTPMDTQTASTTTASAVPEKNVPTSLLGGIGVLGVLFGLIIGIVLGRRL
ncbi:S16 family serine protease [Thermococcus barophilus]|uniref:ATP-dependent protease n=1 Tax=Thermococcus barophilus (strain DSM 11836 / MP) TaxID=391623 RepID=F0LIB0_THEBM|nr:S16 family serine protease [Thermococcus barophilus]ADT84440.1 putative ATP-dependent protease [Thermococcus barophilus MP]